LLLIQLSSLHNGDNNNNSSDDDEDDNSNDNGGPSLFDIARGRDRAAAATSDAVNIKSRQSHTSSSSSIGKV
jgi:hypothetical protein